MEKHATIIPMSDSSKRITSSDVRPTVLPDAFLHSDEALAAARFRMPHYGELPAVDLYRDQVIGQIESILEPLSACSDGPWLTPSMVNNYVKQHVLPTPRRKRYGREHVACLIAICLLKRTFSIGDIQRLLDARAATHELETAYDFFCTTVEESLRVLFCGTVTSDKLGSWAIEHESGFAFALKVANAGELSPERRMAISAATCAANKIYVEKCFELGILGGAFAEVANGEEAE